MPTMSRPHLHKQACAEQQIRTNRFVREIERTLCINVMRSTDIYIQNKLFKHDFAAIVGNVIILWSPWMDRDNRTCDWPTRAQTVPVSARGALYQTTGERLQITSSAFSISYVTPVTHFYFIFTCETLHSQQEFNTFASNTSHAGVRVISAPR